MGLALDGRTAEWLSSRVSRNSQRHVLRRNATLGLWSWSQAGKRTRNPEWGQGGSRARSALHPSVLSIARTVKVCG